MKKIIGIFIILIIFISVIIWLGMRDTFTPFVRENITKPIYTIGDLNYEKGLKSNKKVVKFGPAFWGIYPGGLAFQSINEAKEYFEAEKDNFYKINEKWAIYVLSGDFEKDTTETENNSYINKSLLVIKLQQRL